MQKRFAYALTAGLLSSGAPAGLLGVRLARKQDGGDRMPPAVRHITDERASYVYVGAATAIIFGVFGYLLGRKVDTLRIFPKPIRSPGCSTPADFQRVSVKSEQGPPRPRTSTLFFDRRVGGYRTKSTWTSGWRHGAAKSGARHSLRAARDRRCCAMGRDESTRIVRRPDRRQAWRGRSRSALHCGQDGCVAIDGCRRRSRGRSANRRRLRGDGSAACG